MKKQLYISAIMVLISGLAFCQKANAQCCNVFASNGTAVVTSEGNCATLAYPTTACEEILLEIITVDVWIFYEEAFSDVRFATDSDVLTPTSFGPLDKITNAMKNSRYTLKVSGYADSTGTEEHNKDLSARRAIAVKKYLVDNGVDANRVVLGVYGEKMPKAPNSTKRGRAINRRVEFDLY
jgi:outer membrane protein OmpA-like peptidoglycan-associated protein